jgi:hypothetical protein
MCVVLPRIEAGLHRIRIQSLLRIHEQDVIQDVIYTSQRSKDTDFSPVEAQAEDSQNRASTVIYELQYGQEVFQRHDTLRVTAMRGHERFFPETNLRR